MRFARKKYAWNTDTGFVWGVVLLFGAMSMWRVWLANSLCVLGVGLLVAAGPDVVRYALHDQVRGVDNITFSVVVVAAMLLTTGLLLRRPLP